MGFNSDIFDGLAKLLQSAGVAVYRPTGVYTAGETAITFGVTPDKPDRNITITTYPVADADLTTVTLGVQMRMRAGRDPRDLENLSDAVYDVLHNRRHFRLNNVHVELAWRQSAAWLGQDSDQRMERVENFYLHAERAAPNQIP